MKRQLLMIPALLVAVSLLGCDSDESTPGTDATRTDSGWDLNFPDVADHDAALPEDAGLDGQPDAGCQPESDAAFCARLVKDCGQLDGTDNCNQARTTSCGTCTAPATCGGGGTENVCGFTQGKAHLTYYNSANKRLEYARQK